jgi:hypothetical protein
MKHPSAKFLLTCTLWLASLLASSAEGFTVTSKIVQAPEMDPYTCYEISYQGENYSLVPPFGWRAESDAASALLRFVDRQGTARVVMTFSPSNATEILATTESLRAYAVPDLSQAEVLGTFPVLAGGASGKAVDLGWQFHGAALRCRAAVLPLRKGGSVSFVLHSENTGFKSAEQVLNGLMITFQPSRSTAQSAKR